MAAKFEKMHIQAKDDKRIKIDEYDKMLIVWLYNQGSTSQRKLAKDFGVSRRTIQFTIDPQKRRDNYSRRVQNGGSKQYYDKHKQRQFMRNHRSHKRELYKNGELI